MRGICGRKDLMEKLLLGGYKIMCKNIKQEFFDKFSFSADNGNYRDWNGDANVFAVADFIEEKSSSEDVKWTKIEDCMPSEKGYYVVLIANPYTKPVNNSLQIQYFDGKNFEREKSGGAYLSHWLENLEKPEMSFEEANKLVTPH